MQQQATDKAGAEDNSSTVEDIKALAPLTEEWLKAKARQYLAGRDLVAAEWSLVKKSFLVVILFLLLFTACITVFLAALNITMAFALFQANTHWLLIALVILVFNLGLTLLCLKMVKRVSAKISMPETRQVLSKKSEVTEES